MKEEEEEGEKESERKRDSRAWNRFLLQPSHAASAAMPNFAGNWKMRSSENFDELLKALGESSTVPLLLHRFAPASYP